MANYILEAALKYLDMGFTPLPIAPGTKRPCVTWKQYQTVKPGRGTIKHFWERQPGCGVGLVTGNGLAVVDLDGEKGLASTRGFQLPPTPSVHTARGWHLYFYVESDLPSVNGLLPGVDFKCRGGFVVAPPSKNQSGVIYSWAISLPEEERKPLPPWVRERVRDHRLSAMPQAKPTGLIPFGDRNDTCFRVACGFARNSVVFPHHFKRVKGLFKKCCDQTPVILDSEILRVALNSWNLGHPNQKLDYVQASVMTMTYKGTAHNNFNGLHHLHPLGKRDVTYIPFRKERGNRREGNNGTDR